MTPDEEQELLDLLRAQHILMVETKKLSEEHVAIAREYKEVLGDPIKKGMFAWTVIKKLFAWITGVALTFWGVREIFNYYFISKLKP